MGNFSRSLKQFQRFGLTLLRSRMSNFLHDLRIFLTSVWNTLTSVLLTRRQPQPLGNKGFSAYLRTTTKCYTTIMMKNAMTLVAALLCINANSFAQQICYSISDSENKVYEFRLSDGSVLDSKSLSSLSSPEASTLNLAGDTLWVLNKDELHYIPVSSSLNNTKISGSNISSQTLTGSEGSLTIDDFDAMSVDANGDIWAGSSDNNPCLLVVLDRSTGNVKENYFGAGVDYLKVDNHSYPALRFDAMAFDPLTNELYASMNGLSQNYDYLFKIHKTTGAMTLFKQISQTSDVEGMAFDAKGDLYLTTGANSTDSDDDNKLWKVDLRTGITTEVFSLGGSDVETCDCVIGDPVPTVEISGTIYFDQDKDGTYDAPDFEKTTMAVELYTDVNANGTYESGTDVLAQTTTSYADGTYYFRVEYDGSGTDRYLVRIDTNDFPSGSSFSGSDILAVSVSGGSLTIDDNDFGFESDILNAFEGFTFTDSDNDQTYDYWEPPLAGVTVYLYEDDNCNGQIDGSDAILDSTTVGDDGKYVFLQNYTGSGGSAVCFITTIDTNTLPTGASLTTDNIETASFTAGGGADQNNNFGVWGGSIAALPVEWLTFTGVQVPLGVELNWSTAMEENNSHFEVQRTQNGEEWTTIGEVSGAGFTNEVSDYLFLDENPVPGVNYYRIKQIDYDGFYDFSRVVVVEVHSNTPVFNVVLSPNPASDKVTVTWNKTTANASVSILDMSGKLVYSADDVSGYKTQLDLTALNNGLYFIRVQSDESLTTERLLIRH